MRYKLLNFFERSFVLRHWCMPKRLFTKLRHATKCAKNKQRVTVPATLVVTLAVVVLSPSVL
jgi:hypothetical protein